MRFSPYQGDQIITSAAKTDDHLTILDWLIELCLVYDTEEEVKYIQRADIVWNSSTMNA